MLLPLTRPTHYAEFRLGFLAEPVSVRVARSVVRAALETWDLPDLVDGSAVVVSELVTNGAKASPGDWMEMTVRLQRDGVLLSCWDCSPLLPACPNADDPEAESGRGMWVIECYAAKTGVEADAARTGKSVWALMAFPEHGGG